MRNIQIITISVDCFGNSQGIKCFLVKLIFCVDLIMFTMQAFLYGHFNISIPSLTLRGLKALPVGLKVP